MRTPTEGWRHRKNKIGSEHRISTYGWLVSDGDGWLVSDGVSCDWMPGRESRPIRQTMTEPGAAAGGSDDDGMDPRVRSDGADATPASDNAGETSTQSAGYGARLIRRINRGIPATTRSYLDSYGTLVIVAFLVVAAGGGYGIYAVETMPETEPQTQTVAEWSTAGEFSHGATVENGTAVFQQGEQLTNRPLYFTRLSPELDGEYTFSHQGDVDDTAGVVDLRLVLRAVEEREVGDETAEFVHWQESEQLAIAEIDDLEAGGEERVSFSVNASALGERIDRIEEDLGASPGTTEVVIISEAAFEATAADERLFAERTDRLQIEPGGGTFSVAPDVGESTTQTVTETVQIPVEPSPLMLYGGPIALAVGLLGAAAFGGLSYAGVFALSRAERGRLTFSQSRKDYDQWISRGQIPDDETGDRRVIALESLEDLADVAIDSDRRVIERVEPTPRYVVLVDDIEYRFDPPAVVADAITPAPPSEGVDIRINDPKPGADTAEPMSAGGDDKKPITGGSEPFLEEFEPATDKTDGGRPDADPRAKARTERHTRSEAQPEMDPGSDATNRGETTDSDADSDASDSGALDAPFGDGTEDDTES